MLKELKMFHEWAFNAAPDWVTLMLMATYFLSAIAFVVIGVALLTTQPLGGIAWFGVPAYIIVRNALRQYRKWRDEQ